MKSGNIAHRIIIAGDLFPSAGNIHLFEMGDSQTLYGPEVCQLFSDADFSIVNLEGVLTESEDRLEKASGPSLKASGGGSTEEVYTVINNNTGEIVDPLELHKLTNVIWYDYFGKYYPFYLNGVEDLNLYKDGIYYNNDYISSWVCMPCFNVYFTYLTVLLYYNYTLRPGNSVRIQTTNNYTITDINAFFD